MQNVLEQGPDFWCWFDTTQFSYHCVHPIHAKMFSIQILIHFSQIVQRVRTLVLFILLLLIFVVIVLLLLFVIIVLLFLLLIFVVIVLLLFFLTILSGI